MRTETGAEKAEPLRPFWHLQSSPFWEISGGAVRPSLEGTARPTRKALFGAMDALRPGWEVLLGKDELVAQLGERILGPLYPSDEGRAKVATSVGFKRA